LLPFEDYLTKDKITTNPMFFNDSGNFSKDIFKTYYNDRAREFSNFS